MLLLGDLQAWSCRSQLIEDWPYILNKTRFQDIPIWLLLDTEARLWKMIGKSSRKFQIVTMQYLTNYLLSSLCIKFAFRVYGMSREIVRSVAITSNIVLPCKKTSRRISSNRRSRKRTPASFSSLPSELRMRIFAYVTACATMNVVGYRREFDDGFYFKQRGMSLLCL